ncbi:hypothetical protein IFM89_039410, partial [Coptis chinensis]
LQQWLEYCSNAKKCTCPVCKQKCSKANVARLYFQSIGDANDSTQKPSEGLLGGGDDKDPVFMLREVNKFKGKLSALNTAFEDQEQNLKQVNEEELVKTMSECSRLQEMNMALAKELSVLKLVADVNLEEADIMKLASLGHGPYSKDAVYALTKSLLLCQKHYRELTSQCKMEGKEKSLALEKLKKAKEKRKKLETRVKELELAVEGRDNEALRSLKASSRTSGKVGNLNGIKSNAPCISRDDASVVQTEHSVEPVMKSNQSGGLTNHPTVFRNNGNINFHKDLDLSSCKKNKDVIGVDIEEDSDFLMDDSSSEPRQPAGKHASTILKAQTRNCFEDIVAKKSSVPETRVPLANMETLRNGRSNSSGLSAPSSATKNKNNIRNTVIDDMDDDVVQIDNPSSVGEESSVEEITEIPAIHIRKEVSSPVPTPQPGDQCFVGGLLGPDGANWHLGKWCKRTQRNASISSSMQGSGTGTGDLIAVGADGRGGRIKILRSLDQRDVKDSSFAPKRCQNGSKQSQGCKLIDHFFAKADRF